MVVSRFARLLVVCSFSALVAGCGATRSVLPGEGLFGWFEEERPAAFRYAASEALASAATVIGSSESHRIGSGETLLDVARENGLGVNEMRAAFPEVDLWVPPPGTRLELPTWWVLPESKRRGIVVNIPEMRLYYFANDTEEPTVLTAPVGLGRDDWRTPVGRFRVSEKTRDPTWVIPESILKERIRELGRSERSIPGGHPDNPLGRHRLRLTLPLYSIHGTNQPWGVGMQTSHGCVRLYPEDIEPFFEKVAVGTEGEFVDQPVKVGARDGVVYVEVHPAIYRKNFDYRGTARTLLRRKGWNQNVDWNAVDQAIAKKSGVPTAISN